MDKVNTMKKLAFGAIALIWISSLIALAAALTGLFPDNQLKKYPIIVGFGFVLVTRLLMKGYRNLIKEQH